MKERVQGCLTAGVALVGAGVMAVSPVAPQAPEILKAQVALAAKPITVDPADALSGAAQNVALFGERFAGSFVTAPLGLIAIATAMAEGDRVALKSALDAFVSGPQYVADPLVFAADDLLPPPLGGDLATDPTKMNGSAVSDFRADVLLAARDDVREGFADALGLGAKPQPPGNEVTGFYAASRLAGGLTESAVRAVGGAVAAPLGVLAIAEGLQRSFETGDNDALYVAIRQYIDAPLWAADPAIFAADDVLPAPFGGDETNDPTSTGTSAVTSFRNDVLWNATKNVRTAVADTLGVDPNLDKVPATTVNGRNATLAAQGEPAPAAKQAPQASQDRSKGPISRVLNSFKADPKSDAQTGTTGRHRAESSGLRNFFKPSKPKPADAGPASDPQASDATSAPSGNEPATD